MNGLIHERPQSFDDVLDHVLYGVYNLPSACRPEWLERRYAWESQQSGWGSDKEQRDRLIDLLIAFAVKERRGAA